jgi:hypothetical protein
MNGEFISLETAEKIAKLEKENKKLKKGLLKAINKLCEQDIKIAKVIELLQVNVDWGEGMNSQEAINILRGVKNEIR